MFCMKESEKLFGFVSEYFRSSIVFESPVSVLDIYVGILTCLSQPNYTEIIEHNTPLRMYTHPVMSRG